MAKSFFLLVLALIGIFVIQSPVAYAGAEHNLSGWAWSETIGWTSFNSTNQGGVANYGVNVAADGAMFGYAWSEHIGWISFNSGDVGGCPFPPCQPTLDRLTGQVSGWAKAIAADGNGWDGWIHLRGSNYGITVSACNWGGYAWGSDVVGWIHFRGSGYGVTGSGDACTISISATSLTVSQLSSDISFFCPSNQVELSWIYSDPNNNSQAAFKLQVDNDSDFSSPAIDLLQNSSQHVFITPPSALFLNNTYYWRVAAQSSTNKWSDWSSIANFTTPVSCVGVPPDSQQSVPACRDGLDNDGDGNFDHISLNPINPDLGCVSPDDDDERDPVFREI